MEENTTKQVHDPCPIVVGNCLLVCKVRILTKVLPQPADEYSRGVGTRCLWRNLSPKEELHSSSPTTSSALADNWPASYTETDELLRILKSNGHLTARKVEAVSLWPPPTKQRPSTTVMCSSTSKNINVSGLVHSSFTCRPELRSLGG